jgi:hypothetical protein
LLGLHVLRVGRGGALDVEHVADLALLKAGTQAGDVAVSAVTEHNRRHQSPGDQLVDHLKRQPPLLLVMHVVGQVRLGAPIIVELAALVPLLGDKQPPVDRARRLL